MIQICPFLSTDPSSITAATWQKLVSSSICIKSVEIVRAGMQELNLSHCMGMTFACERFHQYIYGQEFKIEIDHKPLASIFKKSSADSPPRIQQLRLRLQKYEFKLSYLQSTTKKTRRSDHHIEAHDDGIIAVRQVTDEKLE